MEYLTNCINHWKSKICCESLKIYILFTKWIFLRGQTAIIEIHFIFSYLNFHQLSDNNPKKFTKRNLFSSYYRYKNSKKFIENFKNILITTN